MKKVLLILGIVVALVLGALILIPLLDRECNHQFAYTSFPIQWPTCSENGIWQERCICSLCGAEDTSYQGQTWETEPDPNSHTPKSSEFESSESRPGYLDNVTRCRDCNEIIYCDETSQLDPNYTCPPHLDYNEDDYCDFCYTNIEQANCQDHVDTNGDEECDNCGGYIEAPPTISSVFLSEDGIVLNTGATFQFNCTWTPSSIQTADLTWTSSDPSIVTVDQTGKVTFVSDGICEITVCLTDDSTISDTATVYAGNFRIEYTFRQTTADDHYEGYVIIGITTPFLPETLTLPSEYNGEPVVAIASRALGSIEGVKHVIVPDSVKRIESSAFNGCVDLETVTLPNGIESLSSSSFYGCNNLQYNLDTEGNEYLGNADNEYLVLLEAAEITSYTAPAGTKVIGGNVFAGRTALTEVNLSNVVHICHGAFMESGIQELVIPNSVVAIGFSAFDGCASLAALTIGENVQIIAGNAFTNCPSVASFTYNAKNLAERKADENAQFYFGGGSLAQATVTIGSAVQKLPARVFESLYHNTSFGVTLDMENATSLTEIGEKAFCTFKYNGGLTVTFAPNVQIIGKQAFANNPALTSVAITPSMTSLGERVFDGCNIKNVYFDNSTMQTLTGVFTTIHEDGLCVTFSKNINKIPDNMFSSAFTQDEAKTGNLSVIFETGCNAVIGEKAFYQTPLKSIDLTGLSQIGKQAFASCPQLTTVTLAYGSVIGYGAFQSSGLTSIAFEGIANIGEYAFASCSKLATVTLSTTANNIGKYAFYNSGITSVAFSCNSSVGDYAFADCESLTSITLNGNVKTPGAYAFKGTGIETISLSGVTTLPTGLLYDCKNLTSVTLPKSSGNEIPNQFFANCTSFTDSTILEKIRTVGDHAFFNCGFTTLTLPENLESVGQYAFANLKKLVALNHNAKKLPGIMPNYNGYYYVFEGIGADTAGVTVTIGKNVSTITSKLFLSSSTDALPAPHITAIVFEEDSALQFIGERAFNGLSKVESLNIPASVTSIGVYAFANMTGITSFTMHIKSGMSMSASSFNNMGTTNGFTLTLGNQTNVILNSFNDAKVTALVVADGAPLRTIQSQVFANWSHLTSVTLHEGLESLSMAAFYGSAVTELRIPASVTTITGVSGTPATSNSDPKITNLIIDAQNESFAFVDGVLYSKDMTTLVWYPCAKTDTSFTFPASVTEIEEYAFAYARKLQTVTLSASVTSIPSHAFASANSLSSINLDNITSMGDYAFAYTALESFTAPAGLTEIPAYAFYKSTLTTVVLGSQVESIGNYAFAYTSLGFNGGDGVTLNEGLEEIGAYAFYNNDKLTADNSDLRIPSTVTYIGENAFGYNPTDLHYPSGYERPTVSISVYSQNSYGLSWATNNYCVVKYYD